LNEPRANATTTDHNALGLAFKPSLDPLQIGKIPCLGLHVGVRDLVTGDRFLATNFTLSCHKFKRCVTCARMLSKQALGRQGEDLALNYLKKSGFRILDRNFRTRWGEIDIIAKKEKEYYFVEVKTRSDSKYGDPIESLPFYRIERLKKMTLAYASRHKILEKYLHVSLLGIDFSAMEPKITFLLDIVE